MSARRENSGRFLSRVTCSFKSCIVWCTIYDFCKDSAVGVQYSTTGCDEEIRVW